ncbi:MAG: hypothetical protein QF893_09620 [Alphaproteobacteria bacterium]|nr:hypothetical protein [Alphaproteobacteria bacterium]
MTKLIPLRSIEHGVRRALALLGESGIREAIEKGAGVKRSASLIRKCGDPDDDRHHLQLRYAVAMDAACQDLGHTPPLLEVHRHLVERSALGGAAPASEAQIVHAVVVLQAALGDLAHTVSEHYSAEGGDAEPLSNLERHQIFEAIEAIEHQAEAVKRLVGG